MATSSEQAWITSRLAHRLGVGDVLYTVPGRLASQMRFPEATVNDHSQPMDTLEWPPEALPWALAMAAQSSAYLAIELQRMSERFSDRPITCPESTYRRLFASIETLRRLHDAIAANYKLSNDNLSEGFIPVLSERLVGEILSMLGAELVSGSGGSTISSGRVKTRNTVDAGGMK